MGESIEIREARIVLPRVNLNRKEFEGFLVRSFGGFTRTRGDGAWMNPKGGIVLDKVWVYDVAATDTPDTTASLRAICRRMAKAYSQDCVYLRLPGGTVEFIDP